MNCFPDFAPNSRKERCLSIFTQICEYKFENCRNFEICENYSILFNRVLSGLAVRDRAEVVDGGHDRWVLRVLPVDLTLHVQRQAEVPGGSGSEIQAL